MIDYDAVLYYGIEFSYDEVIHILAIEDVKKN
jgi:hypothetical protein